MMNILKDYKKWKTDEYNIYIPNKYKVVMPKSGIYKCIKECNELNDEYIPTKIKKDEYVYVDIIEDNITFHKIETMIDMINHFKNSDAVKFFSSLVARTSFSYFSDLNPNKVLDISLLVLKEYFDWENPMQFDDYEYQKYLIESSKIHELYMFEKYFEINEKLKKEYAYLFDATELGLY